MTLNCTLMIPPVLPGACTGVTYCTSMGSEIKEKGTEKEHGHFRTWSTLRQVPKVEDTRFIISLQLKKGGVAKAKGEGEKEKECWSTLSSFSPCR